MKIRAALIGLGMLLGSVLTGCAGEQPEAETVGVESTYCVNARYEIVDNDYCESDESEYDPATYFWWFGYTNNVYSPGQVIVESERKKGKIYKSNEPTPTKASPSKKPRPTKVKNSTAKPRRTR